MIGPVIAKGMAKHVLLAVALCGCTETHLEVFQRGWPLGVGLEARYDVVLLTCSPGDRYSDGCDREDVAIERLARRGDIEVALSSEDASDFTAFGLAAGVAEVEIEAAGHLGRYEIDVAPVEYSEFTWLDFISSRFGAVGSYEFQVEQIGPAFAGSEIALWQRHYHEPRASLAGFNHNTDSAEINLHGRSPWKLNRGATRAELVENPVPLLGPVTALRTGSVLGTTHLSTHGGGGLAVEIVDARAIHSIMLFDLLSRGPADRLDRWNLYGIEVIPLDASGRVIAGCPADGPLVSDPTGLLVAAPLSYPLNPFCEFDIDLPPEKEWHDTTIVVSWNGVEQRIPVNDDP